jgi:adenylosuccinate lyase
MARIWTDESRFGRWLDVELAVCEELAARGEIPPEAMETIRRKARFDVAGILEIEEKVKHDVIAFLTNVAGYVGEESRFIHMGLTSSDVLDTALALQLVASADRLITDLQSLLGVLERRAHEHRMTVMVGRTHGIHAEPITFGLKLAVWYAEMGRNLDRLRAARERIRVGKLSGAVGTFAHQDPSLEAAVCRRLGLEPAPVSTQIIQRDRHAEFASVLAILASSIEKIATEIRNLQRTDILEVEEYFSSGQKGSSAMPHKRNPITSEQLSGLARVIRGNAQAALQNVPLWHERDISHSSVERVILPDSTILADYMLVRLTNLVDRLLVYPERMRENLEKMRGLVYSQSLLLALVRAGVTREQSYEWVQRCAMKVWQSSDDLKSLAGSDPDIQRVLGAGEIAACFDLKRHLRHVEAIFARLFANREGTEPSHESPESARRER